MNVLDLVLLQTLHSFKFAFIAAWSQDLKIGFLLWGRAGLKLLAQTGDNLLDIPAFI